MFRTLGRLIHGLLAGPAPGRDESAAHAAADREEADRLEAPVRLALAKFLAECDRRKRISDELSANNYGHDFYTADKNCRHCGVSSIAFLDSRGVDSVGTLICTRIRDSGPRFITD